MLALERVGKTYPNGVQALARFSAEIAQGEIVAIIGGSGCGKSTLLRAIAGLARADHAPSVLSAAALALVDASRPADWKDLLWKMSAEIARPMSASARSKPSATTAAEATTPSETKPSTRAW